MKFYRIILLSLCFLSFFVTPYFAYGEEHQNDKQIIFEKGQTIFQEGDKANGFYRIEEGQVAVIKTVNKKEKVLTTLGKGDIFGEMAIVDGKPRSASIKTLTETKLVFISSAEFKKKLDSLDPWAASLIKTLTSRLRKTTDELVEKP